MTPHAANRVMRVARPIAGLPGPEDFTLHDTPMPQIGERELLVRTIYLSIAPGVRPLLPYAGHAPQVEREPQPADDLPNPMKIRVGEPMRSGIVPSMSKFAGGTVGQVVTSRHPDFAPGDYVFGGRYWQLYEAINGDASVRLDPDDLPIEADLGIVGRSAFTGWVGYRRICNAKAGEVMVISSAAGSVGMAVAALAARDGLRVIGIASGPDKCAFVTEELGAEYCIDRQREDVGQTLDRLTPAGVDIYFDNVAGALQRTLMERLKPFGRLVVCGMAAEYCGGEASTLPTGSILAKRLRIEGFVVLDYDDEYPVFRQEMAALWKAGALPYRQQIYEGLESAPAALADCLSGRSRGGKLLVRVGEDTSKP